MLDHRRESRFTDSDLVMISWKSGDVDLKQLANVEDVSFHGIGVLADCAVAAGQPVTLTYGDEQSIQGVVRHCEQRECGEFMGIELIHPSRSLHFHFKPELLIR